VSISHWNLYPAPGCGENIHNGGYIWERDDITSKQLRDLAENPGYMKDQIARVLNEGPTKATKDIINRPDADGMKRRETKDLFEIWYYYGQVEREDMLVAGCTDEELEAAGCQNGYLFDAHVVMVNNRVLKATPNLLDSGEFPYDLMIWQKRAGMPWGKGVARQVRNAQRMVNGATRNLMDNAGLAGGPMVLYKQGLIEPEDGKAEIRPLKVWRAGEDADLDHLGNALTYIKMDMMQPELTNIIYLGLKFAEDTTGLPAIMQGQMGSHQPDTLGQTEILNNNASTVRRRIARLFDDYVTEPHIRRYYTYLLQYGEDDDEKGDFSIDARGSSALVERSMYAQQLMQMLQAASNPVYGLDPNKVSDELLKSWRIDPKRLGFDDEKWQQIVENLANPQQQEDPRLQVAQINAEVKQALDDMKYQFQAQENDKDRQLKAIQEEKQQQHEVYMEQLDTALKAELAEMERTGRKDINLDNIKSNMARDVMKLRVQKELSGTQAITPAVEPRGRAAPGRSFQD
jgi:hypothetical protein